MDMKTELSTAWKAIPISLGAYIISIGPYIIVIVTITTANKVAFELDGKLVCPIQNANTCPSALEKGPT